MNRLRGYWRSRQHTARGTGDSDAFRQLEQLEDPTSGLSQLWDQEHDRHVLGRLLELIEPEFPAAWWRAFRRHALDGVSAAVVASEVGVSTNVVLLAKSRILRRLRQETRGLLD